MLSPSLGSTQTCYSSYRDVIALLWNLGSFQSLHPQIFFSVSWSPSSGALTIKMLDIFPLTHGSLSLLIFLKIFLLCSDGKFFIEISLSSSILSLSYLFFEPVQWSFKFWSLHFSVLKFPLGSSLYVLLFHWNFLFFYLRMFPIVCWRNYIIAILFLLDNTNICVMLELSINCLFPCKIRFSGYMYPE